MKKRREKRLDNFATKHSIERMKERRGINAKKAEKRIKQAILRGKSFSKFSSREREYLRHYEANGCRALAYDGFCYIISEENKCITLFALPEWFLQKKRFIGKKKIRDYRKYVLINQVI